MEPLDEMIILLRIFYQGRYWGRLLKVFSEDEDSSADTVQMDFLRTYLW